jgi:hypothetical protein
MCAAAVFAAGCGPEGPPTFEGFGDLGESDESAGDGDPTGDGDGDPTGDGDGDNDCVDIELGSQAQVYFDGLLESALGSDHDGECGPSPGPDFSAAWTAPSTEIYRVSVFSEFPALLSVLRGGCSGALEACTAFGFPNTIEFAALAGQRYTFALDTEFDLGFVYFDFSLAPVGDTPGDCPVGQLAGIQDSVSGSTFNSSNDFSAPQCGGESAPDHAYLFVPPVSGAYRIDTFGSDFDTLLHVFYGECGGGFIGCNDDAGFETLESEVEVELTEGTPYTIVVDGFGESAGNYQLNLELIGAQPGFCDGADVLNSEVPLTIEWPLEFDFGNLYFGCTFASAERRMVWYAPADGIYRASQDASPNFSGLSVLLEGCTSQQQGLCASSIPGQEPTLAFFAFAGQEIVFVSEWQPDVPGVMSLTIEAEPDALGCGEPLGNTVPAIASGSTLGAGNDFEGSCSFDGAPEAELWWTAPATATYLLSLEGSNYDTLMYVRDGGCDGVELGCNDDTITDQMVDLWSSLQLDLTAGQTISIFIDGYNGSGSYQLEISQL